MRILLVCLAALFALSTVGDAAELRVLTVGYPSVLLNHLNRVVVPEFEALYGVDVTLDSTSWDNRMDKILISIAAGVPYDVVSTGAYSAYEEGSQGILTPLNEYLDEWPLKDRFPQLVWEALSWRGKIYAVPQNHDLRGIAYNQRLFAEAGLDPQQPPQSWEELIAAARALTRLDGDQVLVRGFARSSSIGGYAHELFWFMRQAGVPEVDVERLTSNLNRPEALDALRALAELAEASHFTLPPASGSFVEERVAMQRQHPGLFFRVVEQNPDLADHYGLFAPRRSPSSCPVAHGFVNGLGILAESKAKDGAWRFISFLYEDEVLAGIERVSGFFSGRIDMVERTMEIHPNVVLFYNLFDYFQSSVIPPPRDTAQQEVGRLVQQVYEGRVSPEEALMRSHDLWTRLLAEWSEALE